MRAAIAAPAPAVSPHDALALALEEEMGITPDLAARPELAEALLFGPMLPARHRLDGPGAMPDAAGADTSSSWPSARGRLSSSPTGKRCGTWGWPTSPTSFARRTRAGQVWQAWIHEGQSRDPARLRRTRPVLSGRASGRRLAQRSVRLRRADSDR